MTPAPSLRLHWLVRYGERLGLLAERAIWWPARRTLVVADLHLGKCETYRALGVPAPDGVGDEALRRLERLARTFEAERLVILGDLVHDARGLTPAVRTALVEVRPALPREVILVPGNHDARAGALPEEWSIRVAETPFDEAPFAFLHHPAAVRGRYALAGHLHPTFSARDGFDALRLPCFHFGPRVGVLPAFTAFARGVPMAVEPGDSVFAIAEGEIVCASREEESGSRESRVESRE